MKYAFLSQSASFCLDSEDRGLHSQSTYDVPKEYQLWPSLRKLVSLGRFTTFRLNKIGAGHFRATLSARRSESAQAKISAEKKNELTLLYSALIKKKNSYSKLIFLRSMVIRYIGNMIAFLRCHYAYLSITITSKLSALNLNKILYYCNCQATISSSVHTFASFFSEAVKIYLVTIKEAATCDASLQVLCNAACVKTQHC